MNFEKQSVALRKHSVWTPNLGNQHNESILFRASAFSAIIFLGNITSNITIKDLRETTFWGKMVELPLFRRSFVYYIHCLIHYSVLYRYQIME